MTTKHYVNDAGQYIGGFGDGAKAPVGAIEVPEPPHGKAIWDGSSWSMPQVSRTREQQEANRQAAYKAEADPLFFKYMAGEATQVEWMAKREEIRGRFPYPEA